MSHSSVAKAIQDKEHQRIQLKEKRRRHRIRGVKKNLETLDKRKKYLLEELASVEKQILEQKDQLRVKYKDESSDN